MLNSPRQTPHLAADKSPAKFPHARRQRFLLAGIALILVLLLALGLVVRDKYERLKEANRWNVHTYQVLERVTRLSNLLDPHEAQLRGFALTGDTECLRQLKKSNGIGVRALADLRALTSDRTKQQQELDKIEPRFLAYKARFVTPFMRDDVAASQLAPLRALSLEQTGARARQTSQLKVGLQTMEGVERALIETRARDLAVAQRGTTQALSICSACVLILALTLTFLLTRSVHAWQAASEQSQSLNESLIEEISERRTIEESLRASETGFRHLAEDSLDMICRHAPDGTLTYVSPASLPLLGYAPTAMVGAHPAHFIFERTMDEATASTAAVFAAQL